MTNRCNFGELVRDIRLEKKMSQRELARRSGVNRNILRRLECDNIGRLEVATMVLNTLGYSLGVVRHNACN